MSVIYCNTGGLRSTYTSVIHSTILYVFSVNERRLLCLFGYKPRKYTEKISNVTIKLACYAEVTLPVSSV